MNKEDILQQVTDLSFKMVYLEEEYADIGREIEYTNEKIDKLFDIIENEMKDEGK